jgi:hypothetical protein
VLDAPSQLVIGQAYYKKGDYAGCVKYIQKDLNASMNTHPISDLLERCQNS